MQLSPTTPPAAPPSSVRTLERYGTAFMALPGMVSVSARGDVPAITLSVQTSELAHLVGQVLVDTVDGVRLLVAPRDGGQPVAADSWVRNPTNVLRAMTALPGVLEWRQFAGNTLVTDTAARAAWLAPLLRPTVGSTPLRVIAIADLP